MFHEIVKDDEKKQAKSMIKIPKDIRNAESTLKSMFLLNKQSLPALCDRTIR